MSGFTSAWFGGLAGVVSAALFARWEEMRVKTEIVRLEQELRDLKDDGEAMRREAMQAVMDRCQAEFDHELQLNASTIKAGMPSSVFVGLCGKHGSSA